MGVQAFLGYALKTAEERYFKIDLDEVGDRPYITGVNTDLKTQSVAGSYLALVQHYFVSAWVPDADDQPIYSFTQTAAGDNVGRSLVKQSSSRLVNQRSSLPTSTPAPKTKTHLKVCLTV